MLTRNFYNSIIIFLVKKTYLCFFIALFCLSSCDFQNSNADGDEEIALPISTLSIDSGVKVKFFEFDPGELVISTVGKDSDTISDISKLNAVEIYEKYGNGQKIPEALLEAYNRSLSYQPEDDQEDYDENDETDNEYSQPDTDPQDTLITKQPYAYSSEYVYNYPDFTWSDFILYARYYGSSPGAYFKANKRWERKNRTGRVQITKKGRSAIAFLYPYRRAVRFRIRSSRRLRKRKFKTMDIMMVPHKHLGVIKCHSNTGRRHFRLIIDEADGKGYHYAYYVDTTTNWVFD